jgi:hypothetical protein
MQIHLRILAIAVPGFSGDRGRVRRLLRAPCGDAQAASCLIVKLNGTHGGGSECLVRNSITGTPRTDLSSYVA